MNSCKLKSTDYVYFIKPVGQPLKNKASRGVSYIQFPEITLYQNRMKMNLYMLLQKYGFSGVKERNGSFEIIVILCKWKRVTLCKTQCSRNAKRPKIWLCGNWDFKDLAASLQTNREQSVFSGAISTLLPWPHMAPTFFLSICHRFRKNRWFWN